MSQTTVLTSKTRLSTVKPLRITGQHEINIVRMPIIRKFFMFRRQIRARSRGQHVQSDNASHNSRSECFRLWDLCLLIEELVGGDRWADQIIS